MPQQITHDLALQLLEKREQLATMLPADTLAKLDAYAESLGRGTYPRRYRRE